MRTPTKPYDPAGDLTACSVYALLQGFVVVALWGETANQRRSVVSESR